MQSLESPQFCFLLRSPLAHGTPRRLPTRECGSQALKRYPETPSKKKTFLHLCFSLQAVDAEEPDQQLISLSPQKARSGEALASHSGVGALTLGPLKLSDCYQKIAVENITIRLPVIPANRNEK